MKPKAASLKLQRRIDAWQQMVNSPNRYDAKVCQRINTGGYKCPGSRKG